MFLFLEPAMVGWIVPRATRGLWGGSLTARRTHMKHATDFIGWCNVRTQRMTGVSLGNAEHLYLAYHEGQGGYNPGTWRSKPGAQRAARQVAERAER